MDNSSGMDAHQNEMQAEEYYKSFSSLVSSRVTRDLAKFKSSAVESLSNVLRSNLWVLQTRAVPSSLPVTTNWLSALKSTQITSPLRSEEHTSELQSHSDLVCRLL